MKELFRPMCVASCILGLSISISGCGPAEQKVDDTKAVVPSAVENLRSSLMTLAESGQFDSGTPMLKDTVNSLQGTAGVDAAAVGKEIDEMLAMTNPDQIKAKAKAIADKLPK